MKFLPAAKPSRSSSCPFHLLSFFLRKCKKGHISPHKGVKLDMELILAMRKPMLRSKLTLKAIKRPKRPFNEFASSSNNEFASSSNNEQNPLDESMRYFGPSNIIQKPKYL